MEPCDFIGCTRPAVAVWVLELQCSQLVCPECMAMIQRVFVQPPVFRLLKGTQAA